MENLSIMIPKQAYKKAYLHACKYISDDVVGVLTGKIVGNNYKVIDSFPLFHTRILQGPLEIALDLVQAHIGNEFDIIGVYEARVASVNMSEVAKDLLEAISLKIKKDSLFMKVLEDLSGDDDKKNLKCKVYICFMDISMKFYMSSQTDSLKLQEENQFDQNILSDLLKQGQHWKLIDFDAHFENIALDFRNQYLND